MRKEDRSYDITASWRDRKRKPKRQTKTSDLEDDLTARVTRFACFTRFRRAIKGTCQAHCWPEFSLTASWQRARSFPLGRSSIPFARFAFLKIPAIDCTPFQKKRCGFWREAQQSVFAKLVEDRLEGRLEAETFSRR